MQHSRQPDVADHFHLPEHLGRDVLSRDRFADDLELIGPLQRSRRLNLQRAAGAAVPIELGAEVPAADQVRVGNSFGRVGDRVDDSIGDRKLIGGNCERCCRHLDQQATSLGGRAAQ